jgi:hypothetical protein
MRSGRSRNSEVAAEQSMKLALPACAVKNFSLPFGAIQGNRRAAHPLLLG